MPILSRALRVAASVFPSAVFTCESPAPSNYPVEACQDRGTDYPPGGPLDFTARVHWLNGWAQKFGAAVQWFENPARRFRRHRNRRRRQGGAGRVTRCCSSSTTPIRRSIRFCVPSFAFDPVKEFRDGLCCREASR